MLRQALANILPLAAAPLALSLPAQAALFDFGFEDQPGAATNTAQFTSRDITKDGLTASISRPNGTSFSFTNELQPLASGGACLFSCAPSSWGARSLSPFAAETVTDYFTVEFSQLVSSVSIQAGDKNEDPDEARLELYDINGSLLASTSLNQTGAASIPDDILGFSLSRSSNEIKSIRLYGGSVSGTNPRPNSLFWDNLSVRVIDPTVSPVPAPLPLLGAGAAFGFSRKIRRRIRSIT
jgi:hypothetical protein